MISDLIISIKIEKKIVDQIRLFFEIIVPRSFV